MLPIFRRRHRSGARERRHLGALGDLSDVIAAEPPQSLAQSTVDILEQRLDYENGAILLLDSASGGLTPIAVSRQGGGDDTVKSELDRVAQWEPRVGKGVTGWVAQTGRPALLPNVDGDQRFLELREVRSELCVPIVRAGKTLGVFNIESSRRGRYDAMDRDLMQIIAGELALALSVPDPGSGALAPEEGRERKMCLGCKRVQQGEEAWMQVDRFLLEQVGIGVRFRVCPLCMLTTEPEP